MSKGLWAVIALGGICVAGFAAWQRHDEPAARKKIEATVSSPPLELSMPTSPTVVQRRAVVETPPVAEVPTPMPIASVQPEPPVALTPEQRTFELQQRFEQDAPADVRAYNIGKDVRVALERALGTAGELRDVTCKLKTCRASLGFADLAADNTLFRKILSAGEGPFASFEMHADRKIGPEGAVSTILFFYL